MKKSFALTVKLFLILVLIEGAFLILPQTAKAEVPLTDEYVFQKHLKEAEDIYQAVINYYNQGKFQSALTKFKELEEKYPGYKNCAELSQKVLKAVREQGPVRKESAAVSSDMNVLPQELTDRDREIVQKALDSRRNAMESLAEQAYGEAQELYRSGDLVQAQLKFIEVESIWPNFKDTGDVLADLDNEIQEQQPVSKKKNIISDESPRVIEKVVERVVYVDKNSSRKTFQDTKQIMHVCEDASASYQQAIRYYKGKDYKLAKDKFLEVNNLAPCYKESVDYLNKIDEKIALQEQKAAKKLRQEERKRLGTQIKQQPAAATGEVASKKEQAEASLYYDQAMFDYKKKDFESAKDLFIKADAIMPGYKLTKKYMVRIDEDIALQKIKDAKLQEKAEKQSAKNAAENKEKREAFIRQGQELEKKEKLSAEEIQDKIINADVGENAKQIQDKAERMYQDALTDYDAGRLKEARKKFADLNSYLPGYRSAAWYIDLIDLKLAKMDQKPDNRLIEAEKESGSEFLKAQESYKIPDEKPVQADWERQADERVALLKAKEENLEYLKGERYKEFKKDIQLEKEALAKVEKERKRQDRFRYVATKKRLEDEEKARVRAKKAAQEEAKQKEKELKLRVQTEELAARKKAIEKARQEKEKALQDQLIQKQIEHEVRRAEEQKKRELEAQLWQLSKNKVIALRRQRLATAEYIKMLTQEIAAEEIRVAEQEESAKKKEEEDRLRRAKEEKNLEAEKSNIKEQLKQVELEHHQKMTDVEKEQKQQLKEKDIREVESKNGIVAPDENVLKSADYDSAKQEQDGQKAAKEMAQVRRDQNRLKAQQERAFARARKDIYRELNLNKKGSKHALARQIDPMYKEAVQLLKEKDYVKAKAKFASIDGLYPGYKDARAQVNRIKKILSQNDENNKRSLDKAKKIQEKKAQREERLKKKAEEKSIKEEPKEEAAPAEPKKEEVVAPAELKKEEVIAPAEPKKKRQLKQSRKKKKL